MFRLKSQKQPVLDNELTLPLENYQPAMSFSGKTVEQIRYMLARIGQESHLPARLALVSALSGEGVTFMSYALAAVIAHDLGASVCIADLNWHRPYPSALVMANKNSNPVERWTKQEELEDSIFYSGWSNLALLHLGPVHPDSRPMLARSQKIKDILNLLSSRFDYLILDVPAILSTSDSVPLATLADACCMVIRQGATQASDVEMALSEIRSLPVLGTILNGVHYRTPSLLRSILAGR
jgi:Mrp family chromosome partitioning ATPase